MCVCVCVCVYSAIVTLPQIYFFVVITKLDLIELLEELTVYLFNVVFVLWDINVNEM